MGYATVGRRKRREDTYSRTGESEKKSEERTRSDLPNRMPSRLPGDGGKNSGFPTSSGVKGYLDKFIQTFRTIMPVVIWAITG